MCTDRTPSAAQGRVFLLRRVHGFACIADGIGHLLGLRFGLGLRSAKALAKARHGCRTEAVKDKAPTGGLDSWDF